jgi:putative N6-adenine-specific DNA methylase
MSDSAASRLEIFASTAPGLESIAAGELKTLGIRAKQEVGGVAFTGDLGRLYDANLWLRTASRVTVRLGRFHASTFFELERRSRKLPWEEFLPASGAVRLRVTCRKSKLYHSDAVAERVLKAIQTSASRSISVETSHADEDGTDTGESEAGGTDQAATTNEATHGAQLFVVRLLHDECEISADSSGELLHRRGYRQEVGKAPLRETIAAAMVLASGWKGQSSLLDPMCGSGTIPIEAAMIAQKIAPGLRRDFQFMGWPGFNKSTWAERLDTAQSSVVAFHADIVGADRDEGVIASAQRNAERAGVSAAVRFETAALSNSMSPIHGSRDEPSTEASAGREGEGWILTNPPYGIRVGGTGDLRNLYAALGTALRRSQRWRLGILTPDIDLVRHSQLQLTPRFSTSNGGIPVSFFVTGKIPKSADTRRITGSASGVEIS